MVERAAKGKLRLRCAIYTRKSSEEGLEQEFNSLDAQREACEAFIASQRHEGWMVVRNRYDDGGFSGGTMGRPALQQLLAGLYHGKSFGFKKFVVRATHPPGGRDPPRCHRIGSELTKRLAGDEVS